MGNLHPLVERTLEEEGQPKAIELSKEVVTVFGRSIGELIQFVPASQKMRALQAIHTIVAGAVVRSYAEGLSSQDGKSDYNWSLYPQINSVANPVTASSVDNSASLSGYDSEPIIFPVDPVAEIKRDEPLSGMFRDQQEVMNIGSIAS